MMLTGELVRVRVVKKDLQPRFVQPDHPRLLERASVLVETMQAGLASGATRGEIMGKVRDLVGDETDHFVTRGLAKLLMDKSEFETIAPLAPVDLRRRVFEQAVEMGPLAPSAGPTGRNTAQDVLAVVAAELKCTPDEIASALYADLKDHQVLVAAKIPSPEALLHRYNVALVQALLLKASWIELEITEVHPKYVRQLMRALKFHQLMYRFTSQAPLRLRVDGPQSLLKLSTRYGMQLANFFPTIVLQPGPWTLSAEVLWGRKRKLKKALTISSELGLQSHYQDQGTWTSRTETWFAERFELLDTPWRLGPGEPIDMGGQAMMVPDFTFERDGKKGHLEIVGFWRKGYLEKRIKLLPANVILAVSSRLAGDKTKLPAKVQDQIIQFAEVIPPKKVVERLEAVAR
jgi:predicted nuclease of restriction endonuclease-like RecB superfamily